MHQDQREWRQVPGYPQYLIAEDGAIQDVNTGIMLKQAQATDGKYPKVFLRDHLGGVVHHYVHNLVARIFIGPPPTPKSLVMHQDHNEANSHFKNLAWGTHLTNARGRMERGTVRRGEQLHNAVLTAEKAKAIREAYAAGRSCAEVAEEFGVTRSNVNAIVNYRSWRDAGGPPIPAERRKRKGEKLTEQDVRLIRTQAEEGLPHGDIAAAFNVSKGAIYAIVTGRRWGKI